MRNTLLAASLLAMACGRASVARAQENGNTARPKAYTAVRPLWGTDHESVKAAIDSGSSGMIPLWNFTVSSTRDGNTYSGTMVGQSAFTAQNTQTTIPTQIIPVIFTMPDGGVFDPTAPDPCAGNRSTVSLTLGSPIVSSAHFSLNGVNVGMTQYIDAFQRANFWSEVAQTNYHTLLGVTTLPAVKVQVPQSRGATFDDKALFGACGSTGVIDINWWDPFVTGTLIPALSSQGVNPTTFPVFLFDNVVMSVGSPSLFKKCCILGYHGAFGLPVQTYSPLDFDTSGIFGSILDTSIMAHEVGEWMDDPLGNNPTPAWGHIGQVGGCQNNLEVGDPLTGRNLPPVRMPNGFTYHLQELAFFSWFYGSPSIGAGGLFSDNGTFTKDAGPVCQ